MGVDAGDRKVSQQLAPKARGIRGPCSRGQRYAPRAAILPQTPGLSSLFGTPTCPPRYSGLKFPQAASWPVLLHSGSGRGASQSAHTLSGRALLAPSPRRACLLCLLYPPTGPLIRSSFHATWMKTWTTMTTMTSSSPIPSCGPRRSEPGLLAAQTKPRTNPAYQACLPRKLNPELNQRNRLACRAN